jgi:hypothetical protein
MGRASLMNYPSAIQTLAHYRPSAFQGDGHPGLRRVMPPVAHLSSELWLLTHPDLRDTVRIQAVFQILQQELAPLAARLAGTS